MKITARTKRALSIRRFERKAEANGYEPVGEGGGRLWELYRGGRQNCRIVDVLIGACGKKLWVKIEPSP